MPLDKLFPVLDVLRVLLLRSDANAYYSDVHSTYFIVLLPCNLVSLLLYYRCCCRPFDEEIL